MYVAQQLRINASTVAFPPGNTEPIIIVCKYDVLLRKHLPLLVESSPGGDQSVGALNNPLNLNLSFSLPSTDWQGVHMYKCVDYTGEFVSVTISFQDVPLTSKFIFTTDGGFGTDCYSR